MCIHVHVYMQMHVYMGKESMKGELEGTGCCGGFVARWLWELQSDTLGLSPAVAGFFLFSFLPEQGEFQ